MRRFLNRRLSRLIPFSLLVEQLIRRFNTLHSTVYTLRDEGNLPQSVDLPYPRKIEFFATDRKGVRFCVILRDPNGKDMDESLNQFLNHQLHQKYKFRVRLLNDEEARLNPVANKTVVSLLVWGAEPTPLERILFRSNSQFSDRELDLGLQRIETSLAKKSWKAWKGFRIRIVGREHRSVYFKVRFGEELRIIIAKGKNGDEFLPQFFERIEAGSDIVDEHAKMIGGHRDKFLRSLTLSIKKSGDYRFVTHGVKAVQFHSDRGGWHPLTEYTKSGIGQGVMKRGERLLILSSSSRADDFRAESAPATLDELFTGNDPGFQSGKSILLKRL
jgi:hypothetical protein